MRDSYADFVALGAVVLAVAPHPLAEVEHYAARARLPFPLLADPRREVFRRYDVRWRLTALGQRPGLYVIDRAGRIRYKLLGAQQWELPANEELLAVLAGLTTGDTAPSNAAPTPVE